MAKNPETSGKQMYDQEGHISLTDRQRAAVREGSANALRLAHPGLSERTLQEGVEIMIGPALHTAETGEANLKAINQARKQVGEIVKTSPKPPTKG